MGYSAAAKLSISTSAKYCYCFGLQKSEIEYSTLEAANKWILHELTKRKQINFFVIPMMKDRLCYSLFSLRHLQDVQLATK